MPKLAMMRAIKKKTTWKATSRASSSSNWRCSGVFGILLTDFAALSATIVAKGYFCTDEGYGISAFCVGTVAAVAVGAAATGVSVSTAFFE